MIKKSLDKLNTYAKLGHFLKKAKNLPAFKNSFPYSADDKPTVNKNWFDFVQFMLSVCGYYDLNDSKELEAMS